MDYYVLFGARDTSFFLKIWAKKAKRLDTSALEIQKQTTEMDSKIQKNKTKTKNTCLNFLWNYTVVLLLKCIKWKSRGVHNSH